jgi:hypothetical protein
MSCNITKGRLRACKDAIGGIDKLYFLNYQEYIYTESAGVITVMTEDDGTTEPTAYEYVIHDSVTNLTQNINSNPDNGTTFIEQVITAQFNVITAADNVEFMQMIYGRPVIIARDKRGKLWVVGKLWGADVTAGNSQTGAAMGDMNGYTLTFTARERVFAPEITAAALADFTIVVGT